MAGIRMTTRIFTSALDVWPFVVDPQSWSRVLRADSLLIEPYAPIQIGTRLDWRIAGGLSGLTGFEIMSRVDRLEPGQGYRAEGAGGSVAAWRHERRVVVETADICVLEDRIAYSAPGRLLASWVDRRFLRDRLLELAQLSQRVVVKLVGASAAAPEGEWWPDGVQPPVTTSGRWASGAIPVAQVVPAAGKTPPR
jgi:hypothetical protein